MYYVLSRVLVLIAFSFLSVVSAEQFDYGIFTKTPSPRMVQLNENEYQSMLRRITDSGTSVPQMYWQWLAKQVEGDTRDIKLEKIFSSLSSAQKTKFLSAVSDLGDPKIAQNILYNKMTQGIFIELMSESDAKNRIDNVLKVASLSKSVPDSFHEAFRSSKNYEAIRNLIQADDDGYLRALFDFLHKYPQNLTDDLYRSVFSPLIQANQKMFILKEGRSKAAYQSVKLRTSLAGWMSVFLGEHPEWPNNDNLKALVYSDCLGKTEFRENRKDLAEAYKKVENSRNTDSILTQKNEVSEKANRVFSATLDLPTRESKWKSLEQVGNDFWTSDLMDEIEKRLNDEVRGNDFGFLLEKLNGDHFRKNFYVERFLSSMSVRQYLRKNLMQGHNNDHNLKFILDRPDVAEGLLPNIVDRISQDQDANFLRALVKQIENHPNYLELKDWRNTLFGKALNSTNEVVRNAAVKAIVGFANRPYSPLRTHAYQITLAQLKLNPNSRNPLFNALSEGAADFLQEDVLDRMSEKEVQSLIESNKNKRVQDKALARYYTRHPNYFNFQVSGATGFSAALVDEVMLKTSLLNNEFIARQVLSPFGGIPKDSCDKLANAYLKNNDFREVVKSKPMAANLVESIFEKADIDLDSKALANLYEWYQQVSLDKKDYRKEIEIRNIFTKYRQKLANIDVLKSNFPNHLLSANPELVIDFLNGPFSAKNKQSLKELAQAFKDPDWVAKAMGIAFGGKNAGHRRQMLEILSLDDSSLDKTLIRSEINKFSNTQVRKLFEYAIQDSPNRDYYRSFMVDHWDLLAPKISAGVRESLLSSTKWAKLSEVFNQYPPSSSKVKNECLDLLPPLKSVLTIKP